MKKGNGSRSSPSPCAACKLLKRRCTPDCIFWPYFRSDEPQKFANVHKIFGASNAAKLLNEILPEHRQDAVNSLAYEAEARVRDPVFGCVADIFLLQWKMVHLQHDLARAKVRLARYTNNNHSSMLPASESSSLSSLDFYRIYDCTDAVDRLASPEIVASESISNLP